MRFPLNHRRRLSAPLVLLAAALLGGCAVYEPAPAVLADGTVTYSTPTTVSPAPVYPVAPYVYAPPYAPYYAPYYVGPPVSLGLWFGHSGYRHHGWGGGYRGWGGRYHGGGVGRGGFHGGGGGRHR
jgi:uncharacterized membrane protein YgcG